MKSLSLMPLFSLCMLVFPPVVAQLSVTTTDILSLYATGKGQYELASDTAKYAMNVGSASTSQAQTWTLPTVQYADTMMIKNIAPSSTPYASSFPSATHAQTVTLQEGGNSLAYFAYTRIASDSVFDLGSAMRQIVGPLDTTMFNYRSRFVVKLPIVLGSVLTSRDSNYYGPGDYEVRSGTETFDAYGTITLPNGTFQCLRSKKLEHFTISHSGTPLDTFTVCRFTWMTKEGHQASAVAWRNDQPSGTVQVQEVRSSTLVDVPTSVQHGQSATPATFALLQNYPNPFNPSTTIRYTLSIPGYARLAVYNLLGAQVALLSDGLQSVGTHTAVFNAAGLTSGFYYYRLTTAEGVRIGKMNLVK